MTKEREGIAHEEIKEKRREDRMEKEAKKEKGMRDRETGKERKGDKGKIE